MNFLRFALPHYKKTIEYFSKGKGYGKKKSVRKILAIFDFLFKFQVVAGAFVHDNGKQRF